MAMGLLVPKNLILSTHLFISLSFDASLATIAFREVHECATNNNNKTSSVGSVGCYFINAAMALYGGAPESLSRPIIGALSTFELIPYEGSHHCSIQYFQIQETISFNGMSDTVKTEASEGEHSRSSAGVRHATHCTTRPPRGFTRTPHPTFLPRLRYPSAGSRYWFLRDPVSGSFSPAAIPISFASRRARGAGTGRRTGRPPSLASERPRRVAGRPCSAKSARRIRMSLGRLLEPPLSLQARAVGDTMEICVIRANEGSCSIGAVGRVARIGSLGEWAYLSAILVWGVRKCSPPSSSSRSSLFSVGRIILQSTQPSPCHLPLPT